MAIEHDSYIETCVFKILQPARSRRDRTQKIAGTGFWITPRGYALTCYHVIDEMNPDSIQIEYGGVLLSASLVDSRSNREADIAVLKLNADSGPALRCVRFGSARMGSAVWLFGYREGFPSGYRVHGRLRRGQDVPGIGRVYNLETGLPDSSSIGGMSGAPVLDSEQALVVGIQHGEELAGPAISYVHPIEKVYDTWPDLRGQNATAIASPRLPYAANIDNFMAGYLGTPSRPEPFGGRGSDLAGLTSWLDDTDQPPYLLLTAPAGRGKSAALVRWLTRLLARPAGDFPSAPHVVFVPISLRYELSTERAVFRALVTRLASFHGDDVDRLRDGSADDWRQAFSEYLRRGFPTGTDRLLIVIDGLDEAADWDVSPALFPQDPVGGLRILASARLTARRPAARDWLARLGWDDPSLAKTVTLHPLGRKDVRDVIVRMGSPLDRLADRDQVVRQLHRLSEGDPLILSLYLKDLWASGDQATRLSPQDLAQLRPGLEGYFDSWWDDQEVLWGAGLAAKSAQTRVILNLLAVALGPLERRDLLQLALPLTPIDGDGLDTVLGTLSRFVIANETRSTYVMAHPRFATYRFDKLKADGEQARYEDRFLAWGQQTLRDMTAGARASAPSSYIVQYYGVHLERAGGGSEALMTLVGPYWQRAWDAITSDYGGYLSDIDRAWRLVRTANADAVRAGRRAPFLADTLQCALATAETRATEALIRPPLLEQLVRHRLWTLRRAIRYCRSREQQWQQAQALSAIAAFLDSDSLADALAILDDLASTDPEDLGRALAAVALRVLELGGPGEAFELVLAQPSAYARAYALIELVPHVNLAESARALRQALDDMYAEWDYPRRFLLLTQKLTREVDLSAADNALATAEAGYAGGAVNQTPTLDELHRIGTLLRAVDRRDAVGTVAGSTEVVDASDLYLVVPWLPEPARTHALCHALDELRAEQNHVSLSMRIVELSPYLKGAALEAAISVAESVEYEDYRALALLALLPQMSPELRAQYAPGILAATDEALHLSALDDRCDFFRRIAKVGFADHAFDAIRRLDPLDWHTDDLTEAVAPFLDEGQVRIGLEWVKTLRTEARPRARAALLGRLASFGDRQCSEALQMTRVAEHGDALDEFWAAHSLLSLQLPELRENEAALGLFGRVISLTDPALRLEALAMAAECVGELGPGDFVGAVSSFGESPPAVDALDTLSAYLSAVAVVDPDVQNVIEHVLRRVPHENKVAGLASYFRRLAELNQAREAVRLGQALTRPYANFSVPLVSAIVGAAETIEADLIPWTLNLAQAVQRDLLRVIAISALIPYLSPDEGARLLEEEVMRSISLVDVELYPFDARLMLSLLPPAMQARVVNALITEDFVRGPSTNGSERLWVRSAIGLAPFLDEAMVRTALDRLDKLGSSTNRGELAAALVPRLAQLGYGQEALDLVPQFGYGEEQARSLVGVLRYLPASELEAAHEVAASLMAQVRVGLWRALDRRWPELPLDALLRVWDSWSQRAAKMPPRDALRDLPGFIRAIQLLAGEPGLRRILKVLSAEAPGTTLA